jgi:DNA polymerase sigma
MKEVFKVKVCVVVVSIFTNVTILICQVKHWAKAHEVNSALHRTLNSVSITLLVALHLQVST